MEQIINEKLVEQLCLIERDVNESLLLCVNWEMWALISFGNLHGQGNPTGAA